MIFAQNADLPEQIVNGSFDVMDPSSSEFGWHTLGDATAVGGGGVLRRMQRFRSRFSQSFVIPPDTTELQFTIVQAALQNDASPPPDAFEVALLDFETMDSLVGIVDGMPGSDALLNIQTSGESYVSSSYPYRG